MTLVALRSQLAGVGILVAGCALDGQSKIRLAHILDPDLGSRGKRDALRIVARFTRQRLMFAQQREVRQRVVLEGGAIELGDLELTTVVLKVTSGAIDLASVDIECASVISAPGRHAPIDLGMTGQAFESGGAKSEVVARSAFGGTLEILMGAGQRSRGNLSGRRQPQN
jgi:hypothetical protein